LQFIQPQCRRIASLPATQFVFPAKLPQPNFTGGCAKLTSACRPFLARATLAKFSVGGQKESGKSSGSNRKKFPAR
jgi:hypothetical protein